MSSMKMVEKETVIEMFKELGNFSDIKVALQTKGYTKSDALTSVKLLELTEDFGLSLVRDLMVKGVTYGEFKSEIGVSTFPMKTYIKEYFSEQEVLQYETLLGELRKIDGSLKIADSEEKPKGSSNRLKTNEFKVAYSMNVETRKPNFELSELSDLQKLLNGVLPYGFSIAGACRGFRLADSIRQKLKLNKNVKLDQEKLRKLWSRIYSYHYKDQDFLYETFERYKRFGLDENITRLIEKDVMKRRKEIDFYKRGKKTVTGRNRSIIGRQMKIS
ncbi:hypothetical protein COF68_04495 [Bacillus toyonensis]|uniref:hypothetical protein n=1 Tax=Bacillus toyonensis TaxID=155322 RepID=UPI000BFB759A|nr:hypothetical protein [Bacillus toyonensis]PHE64114.1 hypothetical protein COF68_04495 [Bacillus toyonensis]